MRKALIVQTQHLENYNLEGGNYWKFKGGKEYVISYEVRQAIWEENAYGEGRHSYYTAPMVSQATIIALINRLHGISADFQTFVRSWEETDFPDDLTEEERKWVGEPEAMKLFEATRMTWQELEQQVLDLESKKESQ